MKKIFITFMLAILVFSSCNSSPETQEPAVTSPELEQPEAEPEAETKEPEAQPQQEEAPERERPAAAPISTETEPAVTEPPFELGRQPPQEPEMPFVVRQPDPVFIVPEPAPRWPQTERESLALRVATIRTELEKFEYTTLAEVETVFEELTGQTFSEFLEQVRTFEADPENADPDLLDAVNAGRREVTRTLNTIVERRASLAEKEHPFFWDDSDKETFAQAAESILEQIDLLSTQDYNRLVYFYNDATRGKRLITFMNELAAFADNPGAADTETTTAIIDGLDVLVRLISKLFDQ